MQHMQKNKHTLVPEVVSPSACEAVSDVQRIVLLVMLIRKCTS